MLLMIASSVVISFSGLIVRLLEVGPLVMNFYRAVFLMLAVFILLFIKYRKKLFIRVLHAGFPGIAAGTMLAGATVTFIQSLTSTTVANTLFVLGTIPFFTAALAWIFLSEKPNKDILKTMFIAFSGIILMVSEGLFSGSIYGSLMALCCTLFFSIYAVLLRKFREIDMLPAILISTFIVLVFVSYASNYTLEISLNDLLICFFWGGIMSGFTCACFVFSSKHIMAVEVTIFMLIEFALGPVWVWMIFSEVPSAWTLSGGFLILVAVFAKLLMELKKIKTEKYKKILS